VFEAMASGVPVVTTRVGQAMDLVRHGENGWMVDAGDAEGLAHWLAYVAERPAELPRVIAAGLEAAAANTYEAQLPLWRTFFQGFVEAS
jgi:glycosyltransferase involved in cell wall biosynthesis